MSSSYSCSVVNVDFTTGPVFGVMVAAWLLGTAGAITALMLRPRATPQRTAPSGSAWVRLPARASRQLRRVSGGTSGPHRCSRSRHRSMGST